jgi:hypothetical protein
MHWTGVFAGCSLFRMRARVVVLVFRAAVMMFAVSGLCMQMHGIPFISGNVKEHFEVR